MITHALRRRGFRAVGALTATLAIVAVAACSGSSSDAPAAKKGVAPDLNGDGKVVIGVLSPGDINDKGYYQGFVDSAEAFAKEKGWTLIKRGKVNPSETLAAARALCQQNVDMVALGASELKDAIPASEEPGCANTMFYTAASSNISQTPKIVISSDDPVESNLAAGYAAGLKMQAAGSTKAGFVSGIKADFSVAAANGFLAGIRMLIPDATLSTTYTGDFDDSAKAKEAVAAQISRDISVLYPYLGGATDAAAALAQEHDVMTMTAGTDRCDSTNPKFNISAIYSPGDYFRLLLEEFAKNNLKVGTTRVWKIGVDPFPSVKICDASPEDAAKLETFMKDIGSGKIDSAAEVKRLVG